MYNMLVGADALEQPDSLPLAQLRPNFVGIMAANLAAQKVRGLKTSRNQIAEASLPNNGQNLLIGFFNLHTYKSFFEDEEKR